MDATEAKQKNELEQFLCDVRDYFKASLETSEYENTSNMFFVTASENTIKLLSRCELLIKEFALKTSNSININKPALNGNAKLNGFGHSMESVKSSNFGTMLKLSSTPRKSETEDVSYLDMSGHCKKKSNSKEYMDLNNSMESDKTFRCSTKNTNKQQRHSLILSDTPYMAAKMEDNLSLDNRLANNAAAAEYGEDDDDDDDDDDERQIYDICQVSTQDPDELHKTITTDLELMPTLDCPYTELPAGHLSIQNSCKYGQLQRIEKRLFFDQCKKYYCGILNDWLLCYADGANANRPTLTVHLKSNGVEIEHAGEGKRRDVCFQITTADANKKFLFQASNEVDAKEWIHAIEAAIRGDAAAIIKNARKLPSPPIQKKLSFIAENTANASAANNPTSLGDCIYEEPSPIYQLHDHTELNTTAIETLEVNAAMAQKYNYDIPKCPPQPLHKPETIESHAFDSNKESTESETAGLLVVGQEPASTATSNVSSSVLKTVSSSLEKLDFQAKIKDVHNKLSTQLTAGPNAAAERLKKAVKKNYACNGSESESLTNSLAVSNVSSKEQKKSKKNNNSTATNLQKTCLNNNNNTSISSNNALTQSAEKTCSKNWFLNRLSKTTSSSRSQSSTSTVSSPQKCKQSEKENLLNSLELSESLEHHSSGSSSNPASPILKSSSIVSPNSSTCNGNSSCSNSAKSKVNMIINQFETSGQMAIFSMETLANNAVATFSSFCDTSNDCNNYEPIMTVSTPPSSFLKKV